MMTGKRTKQSSITSMGFPLLQKTVEMCGHWSDRSRFLYKTYIVVKVLLRIYDIHTTYPLYLTTYNHSKES
jgi:hypothetical protein